VSPLPPRTVLSHVFAPAPVSVVPVGDCFVNSQGSAVVDQAIAEKDRLGIEAVWLQLGVI
jgi:hypothetical protein